MIQLTCVYVRGPMLTTFSTLGINRGMVASPAFVKLKWENYVYLLP